MLAFAPGATLPAPRALKHGSGPASDGPCNIPGATLPAPRALKRVSAMPHCLLTPGATLPAPRALKHVPVGDMPTPRSPGGHIARTEGFET